MSIKRINPSLIKVTGASDGDFLVFDSANNSVEFRAGSNAWTNANDYTTYSTLSNLIDTVQDNVSSSDNNAWVNANDYSTYTTVTGLIDTVQANLTSVISAAPTTLDTLAEIAAALENDANIAVTLTTSIGTVSDNVDSLTSTTAANDYATYNTLSGLIDTVQDNVSSQSSNTQVYVGDTLVSNTAVILEAGNGVSLSSNADSGIVTFTTAMGNVTSQVISVDGTANSFTMSKASANSNMLLVFYNGLALDHEEYSVSGTTLTLSNVDPLIADSKLQVRHFDFFDVAGVVEGGDAVSYSFQGSNFGYVSGGLAPALVDKIERYSFTSDANGADVGELSYTSAAGIGLVSSTSGYDAGGQSAPNVFRDTINKFDFSSSMSGSNIATMTTRRRLGGGASSESYGYALGGHYNNPTYNESFEKISFTSNTNGLDVAEISQAKTNLSGHSSETHGYISGGYYLSPTLTTVKVSAIEKTPFSSETSTSSVGSLTIAKNSGQGYSSDSFGYFSGGNSPVLTTIEYFPFASDTNATDGGADLAVAVNYGASSSSTTSGYNSGGLGGSAQNTIQKFPFSSNDNASDIADLSAAGYFFTGTQN